MNEFHSEYKIVNSAEIRRPDYQQPLDMKRVQRIADRWDETQANEPKVAYIDGHYEIFDGQHTLAVRKVRNGGKDLDVRCKVYYGMSHDEAAIKFAHQQDFHKRICPGSKVRAEYIGKDADVMWMVIIAENLGVKIGFRAGGEGDKKINAVDTALSIYKKCGPGKYMQMINIINEAWGGSYPGFSSQIMRGISEFITKYDGKYDHKALVKKLSAIHPIKLMRDSKLRVGSRRKVLDEICEIYNKRARSKLEGAAC